MRYSPAAQLIYLGLLLGRVYFGGMSGAVEVVSAFAAGRDADAAGLVFEYMATTMAQTSGRAAPSQVSELPAVLKDECARLAAVYGQPGTLLVAYAGGQPAGCVGLAWRG